MGFNIFSQYNYLLDEEEDKLKPSQKAALKKKEEEFSIFPTLGAKAKAFVEPTKPPPTITPPKPPSFAEKVKAKLEQVPGAVSKFLFGEPKLISPVPPEIPSEKKIKEEGLKNYLTFPSLYPNPDITSSATLNRSQDINLLKLYSDTTQTIKKTTTDFLSSHPLVNETLNNYMSFSEKVNKVYNEYFPPQVAAKGLVRGIAKQTISFVMPNPKETLEQVLPKPVNAFGKTVDTVSEFVGQVLPYLYGEKILEAGITKVILNPRVAKLIAGSSIWGIIGQTSSSSQTDLQKRVLKLPNDIVTGALLSIVPAVKYGEGLKKFTTSFIKGGTFNTALFSTNAYIDALIEGAKPQEAFEMAKQTAIMQGLIYTALTGVSAFNYTLQPKVRTGNKLFTTNELRDIVSDPKVQNTPEGKQLLTIISEADKANKNVEINAEAIKKNWLGEKLAPLTIEGKPIKGVFTLDYKLVNKVPEVKAEEKTIFPIETGITKPITETPVYFTELAKKYTSATDFASELGTKPASQVGVIDANKITPRDPVDQASVDKIKADIEAGKKIEPIIATEEKGVITTTDGSNRLVAYQQLGQEVPVIITKGNVEGLKTIEEVYNETKPAREAIPTIPTKAEIPKGEPIEIPKELEPLAQEARKYKSAEVFSDRLIDTGIFSYSAGQSRLTELNDKYGELFELVKIPKRKDAFRLQLKSGQSLTDFYNQAVKGVKPEIKAEIPTEKLTKETYTPQQLNTEVILPGRIPPTTITDLFDLYSSSLTKENVDALLSGKSTDIVWTSKKTGKEMKVTVEPMGKPEIKPPSEAKATLEEAKKLITPPDKRIQEIANFFQAKYGKPIEKATASEIREVLTAPENLPLNDKSAVILKKLISPAKGVSMRDLEYKPQLIYGGLKREMFTDGYILIRDKTAAKQFNQELVEKNEKEYVKSLQRSSRELTHEQAQKFAKEETQRQIENADQNYPKDEAIQKILDVKYSDKEARVVGFNNIGNVYLYDGEMGVMADGNRLAFMQKRLPDSSIRLSGRDSAIVFVKGKEITGLLMPIKFEGAFPFEAGKPKKISQKAPASIDRYADLPNVTQQEVFKTIPFPEMVRLAKDLTNSYPEIGKPRFRKALGGRPLGIFIPKGEGKIILNPDVFKDVNQAAKTLAHEIGHLIDYLPDQVVSRGNILGRIGTLRKFLRQKFTSPVVEKRIDKLISKRTPLQEERRTLRDENGVVTDKKRDIELLRQIKPLNKEIRTLQEKAIKNKEVREELINLSKLWKPYGERIVTVDGVEMQVTEELSDEYIAYRQSPEELYADALSVLINDPALLKKEAPVFWNNFFDFLDRKPAVKDAYFELMDFLNEPDDVVQTRRLEDLYKGFRQAREKRLEIEKKEKPKKGWLEKVMFQHVTRFDPIYRKLDKISKGYGIEMSPKTKLRMQLEEMQMRRNDSYLYLYKVNNDVVVPLEKIGLSEDDLGVMLTLERNLGDRKDIANPYGLQGKYSQEALDFLRSYLKKQRGITDEQFNVLEQVARKLRDYQFKAVEDATNAELYSKEFFEKTAKPNKDTYATYQVIEHIHDNYVSAGVKKAVGTLKEIENPFVSSVFKTMAVINQTEIQKGKLAVVKQLKENFADDISPSEPMKARAGVRIGWKPKENRSPLELYEDGKRVAYDVDPYISEMFDFYSPTELHSLVQVSSKFNRVFKPLVTTYNLSWGFYSNISRDTRRTYKNLATILPKVGEGKGLSIFEFVYRWLTAIPSGVQFQRGKLNSILEEMIENKAYTTSFVSFDGQANEEASIAPVMRKFRFLQPLSDVKDESLKRKMLKPITKILEGIEFVASTFETTSKVSGYQIVKRRVQDAKFAGFITRNYVGTPNFIDGGTQKQIDNNVFVFSNVMLQGVRTDLELATNPQTRSGYWFRTFLIDILPKIMMLAAGAGLLGLKVKDEMDKATEYDKTNYLVVPLGTRENGKANYWRIPQDETGRFIGALTWKVGSFINGSLKKPEQLFSLGAGYIPSITPMWEVAGAWLNYAQGRNPYDGYRGREVVDDLTWKAGGLPVFEKMIQYTANQLGLSQFSTYSDETDTTFDTLIKTLPIINRAFKSTDYGLTEKEQVIKKEIDQEKARRILKERDLLDEAIKNGKKNPKNKQEIKRKLIKDALGNPPYDETQKKRLTNLEKKFQIGLIKGELGREMDALIEANTNDYKVELLRTYKQTLGIIGYRNLIRDGRKYKVISDELVKQLKKEKLYYEL